jgi:pectate lyase
MSNLKTPNIPGMVYPTQQAMLAGTPQDSAIASSNAANMKLTKLQSVGGRRNRKNMKRGGSTGDKVAVPQFNMLYNTAGGPGQTPNDIIKQNATIGTQSAENSKFDKLAMIKGGSVYINNDTNKYQWGCYSGGKKYRKSRKNLKSRRSRKSRKSRRSRKSRK